MTETTEHAHAVFCLKGFLRKSTIASAYTLQTLIFCMWHVVTLYFPLFSYCLVISEGIF